MKRFAPLILLVLLFGLSTTLAQTSYTIRTGTMLLTVSSNGRITSIAKTDGTWMRIASGNTNLDGCTETTKISVRKTERNGIEFTKHFISDSTGVHCTVTERFTPDSVSIRWDVEIEGDEKPWTTGISTVMEFPDTAGARFWTTWGDPNHLSAADRGKDAALWHSPFEYRSFRDMHLVYGGHFGKGGGYSIPVFSVFYPGERAGVSLAMSPEDPLLDMHMLTTRHGKISQTRMYHRLERGKKATFRMDLFLHDCDWRSVMAFVVGRYPRYFHPPGVHALSLSGMGAYSSYEGDLDSAKYKAMGGVVNWKASFDFSYMGMFLPPVETDTTQWKRFDVTSEGELIERQSTYTNIAQMRSYAARMKGLGFFTLNYFNVTEFGGASAYGKEVAHPKPDFSKEEDTWRNPSAFLYNNFPRAILFGSHDHIGWHKLTPQQFMFPPIRFHDEPYYTWGHAIATDVGDSAYAAFLLDQARRHREKLPEAHGIALDRIDWFNEYNWHADDGKSWIQGRPVRSLLNSFRGFIPRLSTIMHEAGKVIFCNPEMNRLDMMEYFDGVFNEFGYLGFNLNQSAFLTFYKPLICWTPDRATVMNSPDRFFQRHLIMGAFPMAPFSGNDHSIRPDPEVERYYLDYGPMFNALRGRSWVLIPGVIEVQDNTALANLFAVGNTFVVPVVMCEAESATVHIRKCGQLLPAGKVVVETWYPGEKRVTPREYKVERDELILSVPMKRECAFLVLEPLPNADQ
jgi:hypothetical protein